MMNQVWLHGIFTFQRTKTMQINSNLLLCADPNRLIFFSKENVLAFPLQKKNFTYRNSFETLENIFVYIISTRYWAASFSLLCSKLCWLLCEERKKCGIGFYWVKRASKLCKKFCNFRLSVNNLINSNFFSLFFWEANNNCCHSS